MAELRIDGVSIDYRQGETLLDAARRAGAAVPTLCYDHRVAPGGSCRLCMVEVAGRPSPVAACVFPASEGLEVRTESPKLDEYRRHLLELVLSEMPEGECHHCAEIGPCELHALASRYGAGAGRFRGPISGARADDGNPFILRDYEQCIYCYRCVRVCNELEQAHAIAAGGRGFGSRIVTLFDRGLMETTCTFCGQCINTCPTGALADLPRLGRARATELTASVRTVCPFCGTGCGLRVDVAGDRVVGVRPDFDSPVSRGSLCIKGQFGWEFVQSPERLTTPLIRAGGQLRAASWEEALDLVATRLASIRATSGPDSIVFWSSARATSEANYLFQKFARAVIGTNNVDNCART
jgi:predicted molibdopterin-dependent oxidoreductase YjgC